MRPGVRLAFDVGTVRVGVARSDATGLLAVPLPALAAGEDCLPAVEALAAEWEAMEIVVGLPRHLSGREGASADLARGWAAAVAERLTVPVRLLDERLSSVQAQRGLKASGRTTRESRSLVDSASAVIVLQAALDAERGQGAPTGELVERGGAR